MRRALAALLVLAGLAACTDRGLLAPPTLEPLDLTADGPWLRDRMGRVVLLRGITLSALEYGRYVDEPDGPSKADFQRLEKLGFNVVRVFLSWPALEPVAGEFRHDVLVQRVNPIVRLAAQHGMVVILTLHQRGWSRCFPDGLGLPLWTCTDRDVAAQPGGLAAAACELFEGGGGALNDISLHFLTVWQTIAEFYASDRRVLGFDLLEEPPEVTCESGPSGDLLRKLYRRMGRLLQRLQARQVLFYDPTVAAGQLVPLAPGARAAKVFAPHLFSQTFGPPPGPPEVVLARAYAEAAALAETQDVVFFAGEIGAALPEEGGFRGVTASFVRDSLDALDRHLAGGTIFAAGGRRLPPDAPDPLVGAVRPWARRIAGIPRQMRFDRGSRAFVLTYGDDPERRTPDPTEIFVPRDLYPEGFDVQVLPDGTWTHDESSQRLLVYRSGAEGHAVRVAPRAGPEGMPAGMLAD